MDGRGHDPMTFKRNLHSLAVLLLIRGGSACLFLRQTKDRDAMFLLKHARLNSVPELKISNRYLQFGQSAGSGKILSLFWFPKELS
jgi:hypothetical protein